MLALLAFVLVLGPLILFHELGHFVTAKLAGVRVEEFGFGWPPRLFKFWQSPSRLTIGSTPVLAPRNFKFPKNLEVGQHVEAITAPREGDSYTLGEIRVLDPKTDDLTPRREMMDQGVHMRGALTAVDLGTAYTLNWIPLGGFCRMTGEEDPSDPRSLAAQPKRARLMVLLGGPLMNLLVAILLFSASFFSGFPEPTETRVAITQIVPGSPAAQVGLQVDDVVLQADQVTIKRTSDLVDYTHVRAGQTIVLTLERDGTEMEQRVQVGATDGHIGIFIVGRGYNYVIRRSSLPEAVRMGLEQFGFSFKQMLQLPGLLISGQVTPEEVKPVGPVGISQMAGDAIERSSKEQSLFTILFFAGAISMALGFTNLLPLPALDGGRVLFVLIEAVRGRRVDPAKEGAVHLIGMALLLGLMLILTLQELSSRVVSPF
jgi:regulator of sigma E protease